MHHQSSNARASADMTVLFDWKSDVQRLERHLAAARADGMPDPWTLAEAECSIDLIDNELLTFRSLDARRPEVAETIRRHLEWRARIAEVIAQLQDLESQASPAPLPLEQPHATTA
ncbi:MAG: hypothetical protein JWQ89_3861 [Devosia sp.]|uniref:hypothetical protein n=1 Tax=Devosia sp. TaxID=1871048 RepID=UPI0026115B8D|nr:hypothetical protein [Devosia sp.]MDB5542134.1 hypothetical protein [Devosia sp.]